jgi:mannose/fructose-specific phosphotransferase system component IIA
LQVPKLADALDTSVDYILGRTDDKRFIKLLKSDLSNQEQEIISTFRKLPKNKKERILGYMDGLSEE